MLCDYCETEHLAELIVSAFIQEEASREPLVPFDTPCCFAKATECVEWVWTIPGVVHAQREPLEGAA